MVGGESGEGAVDKACPHSVQIHAVCTQRRTAHMLCAREGIMVVRLEGVGGKIKVMRARLGMYREEPRLGCSNVRCSLAAGHMDNQDWSVGDF